jgi:peptidoglycan/xylan/chitin deacetylase (PgdA/CDA1 family)
LTPHPYGARELPYTARHVPYQLRKQLPIWPEGKRLAVLVYVAPEQWMWDRNEVFPPSIVRTAPGEKLPSLSSQSAITYAFEVGLPRMADIMAEVGQPFSIYTNATVAGQHPEALRGLAAAGHHIEAHGFSQGRPMTTMDAAGQAADIELSTAELERLTGQRPRGWIGPGAMATPETLRLLADHDYTFNADLQDDDLPYFMDFGDKTMVEIPYRMVGNINDVFFTLSNKSPADAWAHLTGAFDAALEVARDTPLLFIYGTHPHVSGRPEYARIFRNFLQLALGTPEAWLTTYRDVADWWIDSFANGYGE